MRKKHLIVNSGIGEMEKFTYKMNCIKLSAFVRNIMALKKGYIFTFTVYRKFYDNNLEFINSFESFSICFSDNQVIFY